MSDNVFMRELSYYLCDVFTSRRLEGNQLAVFPDAEGLSTAEMQAIAREMNLSETTFIEQRRVGMGRDHGLRVRIFTVQEELPFAGHPSLGTSSIARAFLPEYADVEGITLALNVGPVPVEFPADRQPGGSEAIFARMTQPDPAFGPIFDSIDDRAEVAAAVGLGEQDLAPGLPVQIVSTGLPYCIVPLASMEVLGRLAVPARESQAWLRAHGAHFFYLLTQAGAAEWRARMQFYNGEDPATGSAAGCAISYFLRHGLAPSEAEVLIRQGIEMGRPSEIFASARLGKTVSEVRIAGSTVPVAKGLFFRA